MAMNAGVRWLKEYVDCKWTAAEIAERLTMQGLEVGEVRHLRPKVEGLAIGLVESKEPHPGADRLSVCRVRLATEELVIVCGAANVAAGQKVVVAKVGAVLPGNFAIKKAKIRGVESFGMICSKEELGIEASSEGIWALPPETAFETDPSTLIPEEDWILSVEPTSNRGDLLNIQGVAQELAAACGGRMKAGKARRHSEVSSTVSVTVHERLRCPRYMARLVKDVKVAPSPESLATRLSDHGLRPINNVVDVTNLVLLEMGQPLHAFDFDLVEGRKIHVRLAKSGETIRLLDGRTVKLEASDLVIADEAKPIALAGIMGGADTAVSEKTRHVLVEAACFEGSAIRATAKRLGVSSDSSLRFERGVPLDRVEEALHAAVEHLESLAQAKVASGVVDVVATKPAPVRIPFRADQVEKRLGMRMDVVEITQILGRVGLSAERGSTGLIQVTVPSTRRDLREECDLLEEVARIHGYDRLPSRLPSVAMGDRALAAVSEDPLREIARSLGYSEAMNYAFSDARLAARLGTADRGPAVLNPLSPDYARLRGSLFEGLLGSVRHNLENVREGSFRFYEIGNVFRQGASQEAPIREEKRWAFIRAARTEVAGWAIPERETDFFDLSGHLEEIAHRFRLPACQIEAAEDPRFEPGASARWTCDGKELGTLGRISEEILAAVDLSGQAVFFAEIDLGGFFAASASARPVTWQASSPYPSVRRDLALEMPVEQILPPILEAARRFDAQVRDVQLVDLYRGDKIASGRKSAVLRVEYSNREKTFTKEELEAIEGRLLAKLMKSFPVALRGVPSP